VNASVTCGKLAYAAIELLVGLALKQTVSRLVATRTFMVSHERRTNNKVIYLDHGN
jgi:hypothetical protein